ncbi:MAG TPA: tRNA (adenosine(37)-N6)-threonylcarbamoyltransferase complex transferase subunit TsaD [Polyangiaceae bacterium]|nr:MAG: tRNA N6-adenosine threonylcarbamoyltransferase [Deltaproteobacteria bacterium ADurb.Bin207]HNZ20797.1 tRNA (adenosine(37)-N6)-threonylcarbamoyltransferase complex transferase subunit TsaD [Polyangiaceae bacterium]HOD22671.1 tRNA (adenosine(37)-N6)-threonylcarbamoyltransferase complex transferase subunit TsaD [Polyangiaceae bacterium]HOE48227.1 tRNA (adenosine(37)-N6)-threonylcarbamoyltransferase complex transferase subunit TsaD [Polyangiaceae bacterium]HOH02929.1 tRNA (adenosine(37)-N6)
MRILGIESSCDETAAAVVSHDGCIHSDVVRSQVSLHAPYGGVVPELASRDHIRGILPVVSEALSRAHLKLSEIDGIAVTCRPGLMGALLVGVQTAKGLAWGANKPFVGVDHLVGHLLASFLFEKDHAPDTQATFPYVALLASGGHTSLYRVDGPFPEQMRELGGTRDDAVGEAFDKVAKLLGLGYPGGPIIDQLAAQGNPEAVDVPRPMYGGKSLEMSFSGIKTFVASHVATAGRPANERQLADLCASFQAAVIKTLVKKTLLAARAETIDTVVLGGGVAANRGLRRSFQQACEKYGLKLVVPAPKRCTDNGAMIGYAGALELARGTRHDFDLGVSTHTQLLRSTRRGGGKRPNRPR